MKVLHFYKSYLPYSFGGVEQSIFHLVMSSKSFGVESTVLTLSSNKKNSYIRYKDHDIFSCYKNFQISSNDFSFNAIKMFKKLSDKADIIHYHFPYPFADLLHFITNIKKPSIVTYHSDIIRQKFLLKLYRPLMLSFLNSVDLIVTSSPNYYESSEDLQHFKSKVKIVPYGLDKNLYPSPSKSCVDYWKNKLCKKFFLFLGVLRYYKGLFNLLDALALNDFPMVIAGSGPIENELKIKANKLGLKNIIFLGEVSEEDKVILFSLSYAIVFPSHLRSEAFGLSLLEGAMFGKPMISCDIGTGTTFVNIHNKTGIVVPPSSAFDLHLAMLYLWNNPEVAKKMGYFSSARFIELFTSFKMANSYFKLYKDILNK